MSLEGIQNSVSIYVKCLCRPGHDQTLPSCAAPELREALASLATLSSLGILASQIQDASRSQTSVWKVRGAFVRSRPSANCILTKLGAVERV